MLPCERTHRITLHASIERVFPLFTPLGEKLWVAGWEPEFLHPPTGKTSELMVFRTGTGEQETLWSCVDWQPQKHFARYVRVTPSSRFGFVDIQGRSVSDATSEITVTYRYVALTKAGESDLAALSEAAFQAMIDDWQVKVGAWLRDNPHTAIPH